MMKESRIIWPIVLFPFDIKHAHTRSYTGRCWVKDIKASFSLATLVLNETNLTCRYRLFNFLIFDLSLQDILEVRKFEDKPGLTLIKFRNVTLGKLTKFALSGQPAGAKDKIIINVKDEQDWINRIKNAEHLTSH